MTDAELKEHVQKIREANFQYPFMQGIGLGLYEIFSLTILVGLFL